MKTTLRSFALLATTALAAVVPDRAVSAGTAIPSETSLRALWEGGSWGADRFHGGDWMSGYKSMKEYGNPNFVPPNVVPLKPDLYKQYQNIRENYGHGVALFAPYAECHPAGMPYILTMDSYGGFQVVVSDDELVFLYAENHDYRRIYYRRHVHPDPHAKPPAGLKYDEGDPLPTDPTYNGDSIAHWEGSTMVVDTTNIRASNSQIEPHVPKPEGSHIVERYTPMGHGRIAAVMTMTNPSFTRPWVVKFNLVHDPHGELTEAYCTDGNRYVMIPGKGLTMIGDNGLPLEKAEN